MPKQLKDILAGVKYSKVVPGSTGSDPGVDYAPKAPNEQEFVKKHTTEKHADRVGNGDDVYQATNVKHSQLTDKKHGYKSPEDKAVYATEATKCNMTEEGTACPVHEMADCSKTTKTLREISRNPYAIGMASAMKKTGDKPPLKKSTIMKAHDIAKSVQKEEVEKLDEVNHRDYGSQGKMHPDMASGMKVGKHVDFYVRSSGDKAYGEVTKNNGKVVHIKTKNNTHKFSVTPKLSEDVAAPRDDESAEMAKTQLRALANKALHLAMQLNDEQMVEPWVQSKIAVAKDYVTSVHDYMLYGDHSNGDENEQTAPYDGGIDMTGAPRNTFPSFAADVSTGRNV